MDQSYKNYKYSQHQMKRKSDHSIFTIPDNIIYEADNIVLYSHQRTKDTLSLISKLKLSKITSATYGIQLKTMEDQRLGVVSKFCDNFQKFRQYIGQQGNIIVEAKEKSRGKAGNISQQQRQSHQIGQKVVVMTVLTHNPMFPEHKFVLANIQLEQVSNDSRGKEAVQTIVQRCGLDKQFQSTQIKNCIEILALSLQQIIKEINDKRYPRKGQPQIDFKINQIKQSLHLQISELIHSQHQKQNNYTLQNYQKMLKQTESQIIKIKQQYKQLFQSKINCMDFQDYKQSFNKIYLNLINQQNERCSVQFQSMNKQNQQIHSRIERVQQKLMNFSKQTEKRMDKLYEIAQQVRKQSELTFLQKWINPKCHKYITARFDNSFTAQNQDSTHSTIIYVNKNIKQKNRCTIIFDKIGGKPVVIGIIDSSYIDKQDINALPNRIRYLNTGTCRIGTLDQNKKQGYQPGQKIQLKVDVTQGICQWWVNDELSNQITCELIKDEDINWVPYVLLYKDDYVRIIQ